MTTADDPAGKLGAGMSMRSSAPPMAGPRAAKTRGRGRAPLPGAPIEMVRIVQRSSRPIW